MPGTIPGTEEAKEKETGVMVPPPELTAQGRTSPDHPNNLKC